MFTCHRFRYPGLVSGWLPRAAVPAPSKTKGNRFGPGYHLLFCRRLPPWQRGGGGDRRRRRQAEHPELRLIHGQCGAGWPWSRRTVRKKPTEHHLRCQAVHREDLWAGAAGAGECAIPLQGGYSFLIRPDFGNKYIPNRSFWDHLHQNKQSKSHGSFTTMYF